MMEKLKTCNFLEEKEITTDYKGITLELPDNCKYVIIGYYDIGGLKETKIIHKVKFYDVVLESDEEYELRKEKLKEQYYQEYLYKLKELDDDK